jgi:tetratricopeptide (TPR) repeat protein
VGRAVGAVAIVALASLTWNQSRAYHDEATLWKDTLAKNPDSWIAHHNLATLRSKAGELDAAIAGFDEALRCKPGSAESYTGRGFAYFKQGRIDLALADLDRAIELDPTFPQAFLNRGKARLAAGRFDDAVADLDAFLTSNPGFGPAYQERGAARVQLGHDEAALADFTRAIAIGPDSAELRDRRAFVLVRMGRFDDALADFDAALRLDPRLPATHMLRGSVFKRLDGSTERACAEWRQACRLGDCRLYEAECAPR